MKRSLNLVPAKTPLIAKKVFPNYIWDVPTSKNELYLTFDDGPHPEITNWTLKTLRQYKAKATFFCIGANIDKYPETFENIMRDGHAIGNHTQHHVKGWKTNTKAYLKEVDDAQTSINSFYSSNSKMFRPPYGQIRPKQGEKLMALNYKIIMWDVLSFDWESTISEEECLNNVISKSKPGSIIVFHDSVKASKNLMYALPRVLEVFTKKGYEFNALRI